MSKPAPTLAPTPEAAFDCRATAALLKSLGTLVWASHVCALVAVGFRSFFPLLLWGVVLYFAVRVRLDAALLEMLARDPGQAPRQLDAWLSAARLRTSAADRSIEDRCLGARRLGRLLVFAFLLQVLATAVSLFRNNL